MNANKDDDISDSITNAVHCEKEELVARQKLDQQQVDPVGAHEDERVSRK